MSYLMTRDEFRKAVFARDGNKCVFCDSPAKDAHHIMERKLWPDGGYYIDNGASVCEVHHIECEKTIKSVEAVRDACGITKVVLPPHLYDDQKYDKWGNIILPTGMRLRGELFYDESVQKVLEGILPAFTTLVKYPRTHHLPWSPGMTEDDRVQEDFSMLEGNRVIVTEKLDGENTTLYRDYIHARSLSSSGGIERDWVKNFWSNISTDIPQYWRICGENLWAEHSIRYEDLESFFCGFGMWNSLNRCLSWDDTVEWFRLLDITPVPVLYDGVWDEKKIRDIKLDWTKHEGYVVRLEDSFDISKFRFCVLKYVRAGHVSSVEHWRTGKAMKRNELRSKSI